MRRQMWRAVAVYRVATWWYAAVLVAQNHGAYAHPRAGEAVLAGMAGWSAVTIVGYARLRAVRWLVVGDVAVAVALILATRWVDTASRVAHGAATLPAAWSASAVLACAVAGGPWGGLAGAVTVSAADVAERQAILPHGTFNGIVLLLVAGTVGGYVVRLASRTEEAVGRAARVEAAAAERARIARDVHDSVLQVLALVSARARRLGGPAAELGELAGQQEVALRALIAGQPEPDGASGAVDLRTLLERQSSGSVTLSCPAHKVPLPRGPARAVAAAVEQALHNVRRHAGDGARAWVLVEDDGHGVLVTVRDDGVGFAPGRLAEAARGGRLGVAESIVGRLRTVGGAATITSRPGEGTEVELRVPRERRDPRADRGRSPDLA